MIEIWRLFVFLFVLLFLGCAYGPQTKDKTFLQALNGKNYEVSDPSPGAISTPTLPIVNDEFLGT